MQQGSNSSDKPPGSGSSSRSGQMTLLQGQGQAVHYINAHGNDDQALPFAEQGKSNL